MGSLIKLSVAFLTVKLLQLAIVALTPGRFDTSSQIIIDEVRLNYPKTAFSPVKNYVLSILDKFITWDSVYFNDLFVNAIKYEHQFVFCPSWWRLIKNLPWGNSSYYGKLASSMVISNACHYGSFVLLYKLTSRMFPSNFTSNNSRFLYLSSLMLIFSPAGIFLTTGYSESLCTFLSFATIYLREWSLTYVDFKQRNNKSVTFPVIYMLSGTILALNFTVRANAMLLGGLYVHDLYEFAIINHNITNSILAIVTGSQLLLSIITLNLHSYLLFCPGREWCNYKIPSLFSYAQHHYWNVGFLNYWTPNNIPNFLFALPTVIINIASIRYFVNELPRLKKMSSLILVNILLLLGGVFFWHVQILTRISSFLPLSYWYIAIVLTNDPNNRFAKISVYYMIIWNLVQSSLFAGFLPPA